MKKISTKIIILILLLTSGCQSSWDNVKKGLGAEKRNTTDEFLVKKKEPLTMPPDWENLPVPGVTSTMDSNKDPSEINDIEELIQIESKKTTTTNVKGSGSLEKSLLKKIKKQ